MKPNRRYLSNLAYILKVSVIKLWSGNHWNTINKVVQASIINQVDDKYLKWVLIFNFYPKTHFKSSRSGADQSPVHNIESYFNYVLR